MSTAAKPASCASLQIIIEHMSWVQIYGAGHAQQRGAPPGAGQPQRVRAAPQHRAATGEAFCLCPSSIFSACCTCLLLLLPSIVGSWGTTARHSEVVLRCSYTLLTLHGCAQIWRDMRSDTAGLVFAGSVPDAAPFGHRDGVRGGRRSGAVRAGAPDAWGAPMAAALCSPTVCSCAHFEYAL